MKNKAFTTLLVLALILISACSRQQKETAPLLEEVVSDVPYWVPEGYTHAYDGEVEINYSFPGTPLSLVEEFDLPVRMDGPILILPGYLSPNEMDLLGINFFPNPDLSTCEAEVFFQNNSQRIRVFCPDEGRKTLHMEGRLAHCESRRANIHCNRGGLSVVIAPEAVYVSAHPRWTDNDLIGIKELGLTFPEVLEPGTIYTLGRPDALTLYPEWND